MEKPTEKHWGADVVDPREPSLPGLKARYLLDHLPARGSLCEVGSGEGKLLRTVARARPAFALHGCDVRAPASTPDVYRFTMIDGVALPYVDASFEAVAIFDVLEHVPDPRSTLAEIARVLAPGGRVIAFVPVEGEPLSAYAAYRALLGRDVYVRTKEHVQAFTHRGLRELVGSAFDIVDWRYAYHPFGHVLDASFFAATSLPRLSRFWWCENRYYNKAPTRPNPFAKAMNVAMTAANAIAYAESSVLAHSSFFAAGALFTARKASSRERSEVTDQRGGPTK